MKAKDFFNGIEQEQIAEAISEVEKSTSGEIDVMVVDQSDSYPEGSILAGLILGGLASLIITQLFFYDHLTYFMICFTLLFLAISWAVNYLPPLKRLFIFPNRQIEMVREQAIQAFYKKELYKTRDATAVFFFISLFERKLWILADKGIYSKLSPEDLQAYAGDMAQGIRQGRATEVLCKEIAELGKVLAQHFPPREDDTNELSDQVIVG